MDLPVQKAKLKNALLFGSSIGLIASIISIALFNEEERSKELEKKLSTLEEELGLMYNGFKDKVSNRRQKLFYKKRYSKRNKALHQLWRMASF